MTVLTDRRFLSAVHILPSLLPLITLTTYPSTASIPLSIIPHPYAKHQLTNPTSTLLIILHPYAIPYVAANKKLNNGNIQLDTNPVNNQLSTATLSQDEKHLLARGLFFCPTPCNINWTEVRADFHEFSRRIRLLDYFYDYPPKVISTHSVPKATGPLPYTGTLHF